MGVPEFQAVILAAGHGSRMTELTVSRPKCLLPVGPHPVLYHTLLLLENAGFKDAIVVVLGSAVNQISGALSRCQLKIVPELVAIPGDTGEDWGTAESLQYLASQERIKSDVVVVSCDVFTNTNLTELLLSFRQHDASIAALFFHQFIDSTLNEIPPGIKNKMKTEKDIIGIDANTSRLVLLSSASDYEENVPIKWSILRRHPTISLRTDLIDGHIYVLSSKLVRTFIPATSFSTLKGEFLPYVVSKQHTRPRGQPGNTSLPDKLGLLHESLKETKWESAVRDGSSYNDHSGDLSGAYHGDNIRCYAIVADPNHFAIRINNIPALWHANRLVSSSDSFKQIKIDPSAEVKSNQVEDSCVGQATIIHEKTSVRASTISENCVVMEKSRINRSTILRKVEFQEGCVIENCVIGNDVKVGGNCELRNCIVGANHTIPKGTKANFQVLTMSDRLMEI